MDILKQSILAWIEITEYRYIFTYGYKHKLYPITLTFSISEYPHLAGFQYMKDVALPNYASARIADYILNDKITFEQISTAAQYENMIKPRLEAIIHLKKCLDSDFTLYSYMPRFYSFKTTINADYVISSHTDFDSFVFILQEQQGFQDEHNFICCSGFVKGIRDYEENQRSRTLLKKERIHIPSDTTITIFDKLSK
jgi:hypothetical protein